MRRMMIRRNYRRKTKLGTKCRRMRKESQSKHWSGNLCLMLELRSNSRRMRRMRGSMNQKLRW
jgi:hypothetical protein